MRVIKNTAIALALIFIFFVQFCMAQEISEKINTLKEKIVSSETLQAAQPLFIELLDLSIQENKFNELYDFLVGLEKNKVFAKAPSLYYYQALTRFNEMRFLEDNKYWQELFDNKNTYAVQLNKAIDKANSLNTQLNELSLRLKFLQAQLNKENESIFINSLEDLFNLAREYTNTDSDPQVIKELADELSQDKQTIYAKKLYSVYVSKLSESDINYQDLSRIAEDFLKEGNVDLAVSLYEVYLDKLANSSQDKDAILKQMFELADKFRDTGWQDAQDAFFAEKIYDKINTLYGIEAFDDASQYNRAYNLEQIKEYGLSLEEYLKLVDNFSQYPDKDRIYFRIGVINAYIFNKTDEAKKYFLKIADEFPGSQDYFNSLYHRGLLEQWQGNPEKAKGFYQEILDKTKDYTDKPEIAVMAEERFKEIEETRPVEYNLRTFLAAALKEQEEKSPYLQLDLFAKDAKSDLGENVNFKVSSYLTDTGCLQQDFTYLWSGSLGRNQTPFNNYEFETNYDDDLGTKVVNVVLVGPSGVVGGTIEMADIYQMRPQLTDSNDTSEEGKL